jgi:ribosomal protein S18 acetylase RimI-like enzyme
MAPTDLELIERSSEFLPQYETIPIAFEVKEYLHIEMPADGPGGLALQQLAVESPYVKDYDALPGQRPTDWPKRFDLSKWWFAAAYLTGQHVGGVAVVMESGDEAVVWDIRIAPQYRRQGIGRSLLKFAEDQARAAGKPRIKVETQNINVAACRFYAANGYELRFINRFAYPELPGEVQLIWSRRLDGSGSVR